MRSFFPPIPRKELLPGLPAAQTALRVGSQKVCNFHPPETARFTSGVDTEGRGAALPELSSKRERSRLPLRRKPHWQRLAKGAALGLRRGPDPWVPRCRGGDGKPVGD